MTVTTGPGRRSDSSSGPTVGSPPLSRGSRRRSTRTARRSPMRRRRLQANESAESDPKISRASTVPCASEAARPQRARSTSVYWAPACGPPSTTGTRTRTPVREMPPAQRPRPERKEAAYFENDELPRLFAHLEDEPYRTLCLVALKTGMRQGELLALRWGDVDLQQAVVRVRFSYTGGELGAPKNPRATRRRSDLRRCRATRVLARKGGKLARGTGLPRR